MSVSSKMTAIADRIRILLGLSGTMGLDAMATNLENAQTEVDAQTELLMQAISTIDGKAAGSGTSADPVLEELTITANGTYTPGSGVDGFSKVIANVASTGSGEDNSGAILDRSVTAINNSEITTLGAYALRNCTQLTSLSLPGVTKVDTYACYGCSALKSVDLPVATTLGTYSFRGCSALEIVDFPVLTSIAANSFYACSKLATLILRSDSVCALGNSTAFTSTPFASGGSGGTVYVPSALIASYQSASYWATLYNAGSCAFVAIEGSEYE